MKASDQMRLFADQMDAAMARRDWVLTIKLCEDSLRHAVDNTLPSLRHHGLWTSLPRNRCLALYLGYSVGLGRYKVGITSKPERRTQEINAALRHLAFAPDFQILHFGFAPEAIVRASERRILRDYKSFSVGGEWFREDDDVFDGIFDETQLLWAEYDHFLHTFSLEADLTSLRPSTGLYGPTEKQQAQHIDRLVKLLEEWTGITRFIGAKLRERTDLAKAATQESLWEPEA